MLRMDHVGVVLEDLDGAIEFFQKLGFEFEGRTTIGGEIVDAINGLEGVRVETAMVKTPDGSGRLELIHYHTPQDSVGVEHAPSNRLGYRHICLQVDDVYKAVEALRGNGMDVLGEVRDYEEYAYRLCYFRGPEGLIIELAERMSD